MNQRTNAGLYLAPRAASRTALCPRALLSDSDRLSPKCRIAARRCGRARRAPERRLQGYPSPAGRLRLLRGFEQPHPAQRIIDPGQVRPGRFGLSEHLREDALAPFPIDICDRKSPSFGMTNGKAALAVRLGRKVGRAAAETGSLTVPAPELQVLRVFLVPMEGALAPIDVEGKAVLVSDGDITVPDPTAESAGELYREIRVVEHLAPGLDRCHIRRDLAH